MPRLLSDSFKLLLFTESTVPGWMLVLVRHIGGSSTITCTVVDDDSYVPPKVTQFSAHEWSELDWTGLDDFFAVVSRLLGVSQQPCLNVHASNTRTFRFGRRLFRVEGYNHACVPSIIFWMCQATMDRIQLWSSLIALPINHIFLVWSLSLHLRWNMAGRVSESGW